MRFKFPIGIPLEKEEISSSSIIRLEYNNELVREAIKVLLDKHQGNHSIGLNSLDLNAKE